MIKVNYRRRSNACYIVNYCRRNIYIIDRKIICYWFKNKCLVTQYIPFIWVFLYAYTCTISTRDMYQAVKLSNIVQWDLYKTIRWNFIILYSFHSFALLVRTLTSTRLRWYVSSPSTLLYLPSLISLFWATIQDCQCTNIYIFIKRAK